VSACFGSDNWNNATSEYMAVDLSSCEPCEIASLLLRQEADQWRLVAIDFRFDRCLFRRSIPSDLRSDHRANESMSL
jgi:hypothetical protein